MSAAEVLAKHQTVDDWPREMCLCGAETPRPDEDAAKAWHQLDALKAAGYAVVELPKPSDLDPQFEGDIARFYAPANGNHVRVRWSKDIVVDGNWYRPEEALDVAAALLAAAEVSR